MIVSSHMQALVTGRFIPLYKSPDVRPFGIGPEMNCEQCHSDSARARNDGKEILEFSEAGGKWKILRGKGGIF